MIVHIMQLSWPCFTGSENTYAGAGLLKTVQCILRCLPDLPKMSLAAFHPSCTAGSSPPIAAPSAGTIVMLARQARKRRIGPFHASAARR